MRPINVGDKVCLNVAGVGLEGLCHHVRAEVAAANADVHDVDDRLARVPLPHARAHGLAELCVTRCESWTVSELLSLSTLR